MNFVIEKLKEKSTYAGLAALLRGVWLENRTFVSLASPDSRHEH
jgi:hypothetical protein